ncbi:MAG: hypothetical protein ABIN18_04200 [Pseudomonadota bacterium]
MDRDTFLRGDWPAARADQIADVFYVRDLEGQKVEDSEQIEEIRQSLVYRLEQG